MSRRRANGEGTIYRRKDGRYEGAAYVLVAGGKHTRRRVYGATHAEVQQKLTALLRQSQQGVPASAAGVTVEQFLDDWLSNVAAPRLRPKTFEGYESNARLHITPILGRKRLARLGVRDVRLMLDQLRDNGLSPRSVQYVHATLRAALEHAVREEMVSRNVARLVQSPLARWEDREALSVDDAKLLLKTAGGHRLSAGFVLLILLGLRRGELLGLRWQDVDLDAGVLRVRQTLQRVNGELRFLPPKTQRSRRTVPLPALCVQALAAHQAQQEAEKTSAVLWAAPELVFTTPIGTAIDPRNFSRLFTELCVSASLTPVRLHDLRHACVSLLLTLGVHPRIVMEIVGHTAYEMTMNVYGHVALDSQRQALDQLNSLLGP